MKLSVQKIVMKKFEALFQRLNRSKFRSSFHLKEKDKAYVKEKGMAVIESHAHDLIVERLADAEPFHDGAQTPMKGHPVFIAQHATGCCCRGCLEKWHRIPRHASLTPMQINYIVAVVMSWIEREMEETG